MSKKWITILVTAVIGALLVPCAAQTAPPAAPAESANLYGLGLSYNNASADSPVAGTLLYAHKLNDSGTYGFTVVDALPASSVAVSGKKVFNFSTVTTNVGIGVAQKIATIGKLPIYGIASSGFSWTGQNSGWNYSGGGMTHIRFKNSAWGLAPNIRFAKSNVSGAGIQLIPGVMLTYNQ
jgi:hypothetical protein